MRTTRSELHLGISADEKTTAAVVVEADGTVVGQATVPSSADVAVDLMGLARVVGGGVLRAVTTVMLATDAAELAVRSRHGLLRVGVIRVGGPSARTVPPLHGWPANLLAALAPRTVVIDGGSELDGRSAIPLDVEAALRFVTGVDSHVDGYAICSVFAPTSAHHELQLHEAIRDLLGDVPISLSHRFGTVGLVERENATVLNAALSGIVPSLLQQTRAAVRAIGVDAPLYVVQNDGSLMAPGYALQRPILMVGSGHASAMRGAVGMTGITDGIVADIGRRRAVVGTVIDGRPREATTRVGLGGVLTNVRMPELTFLPPVQTPAALAADLDQVADELTPGPDDLPLLCVGIAAETVPAVLPSGRTILRHPRAAVAGAFGAARASISGHVDQLFPLLTTTWQEAHARIRDTALIEAVNAGADPGRVTVGAVEAVPLTYVAQPMVRLRASATAPVTSS